MRQPFYPSLWDQFEDLASNFEWDQRSSDCSCPLSISEDETQVFIDLPMPGIPQEDIELSIDPKKRQLQVRAQKAKERKQVRYACKNIPSQYAFDIPLSSQIDLQGKIVARAKDGIISIILAKNQSDQPLKIELNQSCCK